MNVKKCIVKGCVNSSDQGNFAGDLCAPCYTYLTTGRIGPTTSFLGELKMPKSKKNKKDEEEVKATMPK